VIRDAWRRLEDWAGTAHWLVGASLVRVLLGAWGVHFYVLHFAVRHVLWGADGAWPYDVFLDTRPQFSVFTVSAAPWFLDLVYVAAIGVAVGFALGIWPRLTGACHWLMIWSLQERNPLITDGGDNIMRIVLLFLILVNTGSHFGVHSNRKPRWPAAARKLLAVTHNMGVLLVIAQLGLLYASTGLYKTMGQLWQNGTALYYILRVDEFSWPAAAAFVYQNPYLVVAGTYGTVLFEIMFLPMLLNRWTRYLVIAAGVAFHAGIGLFMGLVTFAWSMLSIYPLLLTDWEYRRLAGAVRDRLGLLVFYDGWCPTCVRSVAWFRALDVLSLVEFVSFRERGVTEIYALDPERASQRMISRDAGGNVREGIHTLIAIAVRSPLLAPGLLALVPCRMLTGQGAYDRLARSRLVLVPRQCDVQCSPPAPPANAGEGSAGG
jgi:predicted DCC family thiol-disulfide oxidoreductase YuxK